MAHGGVDDRQTGARLLPGGQFIGSVAPGQRFGFRAKRAVPGHSRVAHQDVFVEFAPQQFVDPGDGAGVAAFELTLIAVQRGVQALARRNHPGGKIGRELTGTGFCREVAFVLVVLDLRFAKVVEATPGFGFARRPQVAQVISGCCEAVDTQGDRIAGNVQRRLFVRRAYQAGQRVVQSFVADFAELAEDLKVSAGAGQHAPGLEQQLIEVAANFDPFSL
ncbi:hypothetical protein D9M73_158550 [compost metagenome]